MRDVSSDNVLTPRVLEAEQFFSFVGVEERHPSLRFELFWYPGNEIELVEVFVAEIKDISVEFIVQTLQFFRINCVSNFKSVQFIHEIVFKNIKWS